MSLRDLQIAVRRVDIAAGKNPLDDKVLEGYVVATEVALFEENNIPFGLEVGQKAKDYIFNYIKAKSQGGNFKWLEELAQKNNHPYWVIDQYYDVLRLESRFLLDSFMLYIEKNRPRKERFYEPRRKTLKQITDGLQSLENDELDELFVHMPARVGKLLADDTPVFTSDGWKKHGDLVVGDQVIGSDGNFTSVVAVHEKNVADYRVVLSNGEEIYCHGNHEWTVWNRSAQRWHTYETHEMLDKLSRSETKRGKRVDRNNLYLPLREPMQGAERDLKVHPYVLGAWLGDGTNQKPWITDPIDDFGIAEKIMSCGYPMEKVYTHKQTGVKTFNFGKKLKDDLQKYGMCFYGRKCEKHIPTEYLTASLEQRLELLAGLLDTDGTLTKKEHRYHFSTISETLKDDVVTLINTFGWRVCVTVQKPHTSSFGITGKHDCYVIAFNPTMHIPCVLERKKLFEFSEQRRIAIEKIEPCEEKEGNCITVANKDGLYAVGKNMQLTHNSQLITMYTTWHCARDTEKSNLYVTYKEGLGGAFLDGVVEILTDPTYCFNDVFPDVKIADSDAKNNKLDLNRKKKYKTLSGKGLESGLNGEYDAYGVLILDDILAGVEDVLSPDVLKRKQTIFDNNVMRRAKEQCKKIFNGTIWATNDLYMDRQNFLETDPTAQNIRHKTILIPALDPETDQSNFEYDYGVGFSTEYYQMTRAKFEANGDMAGWFAQCQQQPIDRTGAIFDPERMNYYAVLPEEEPIKVISFIDVSLGGADYLSMPVVYYFDDGDGGLVGYVEDVVFDNHEKHITQPQVITKIKKHKIKHLRLEANQGGEFYKDEIEAMLKEERAAGYNEVCNISSEWAMTTKRKFQRIYDNAEEIRKLYFKDPQHRDKQYRAFMNNLFQFSENMSKRMHDDAPDSLSGLVDFERHGTGIKAAKIMRSPI